MQNCMKSSETTEMTVAEFYVNLTFGHQREGLCSIIIVLVLLLQMTNENAIRNEAELTERHLWDAHEAK